MTVPNKPPLYPSSRRIALIGEAPGQDEEIQGQPFVGASGRFLAALLKQAGTSKESCFVGNISQHRPPGNKIEAFEWHGLQIQHGLDQLRHDLEAFKPNVVVLLGNVPLRAAKDPMSLMPLSKRRFSNSNWRGSLFIGEKGSVFEGMKCLSTLHPAYCLRDFGQAPLLMLDLKKAVREGDSPVLVMPEEKVVIPATFDEAIGLLDQLQAWDEPFGTDIEGYLRSLRSIAFAPTPNLAYVLPFCHTDRSRWWTPQQEIQLFRRLAEVMENYRVRKIWQNGLYDRFVLHYGHGIRCQGNYGDIMLKHWELNSELAKGDNNEDRRKKGLNLALQTSIYTNRPYYKGDIESTDDTTFLTYNGRDAMVTKEIDLYLDKCLTAKCAKAQYRMNNLLLNAFLYMELKGMRYDILGAKLRRDTLLKAEHETQARLNYLTGHGFKWTSQKEILDRARELMGFKRAVITTIADLCNNAKKDYVLSAHRLREVLSNPTPDLATKGEVEDLCEVSLNTDSPEQLCQYLYETLQLPTQFTQNRGEEPRPTTDYEALLKLSKILQQSEHPALPIIETIIELRALSTRAGMLGISADDDGRIRCGYNIVGSNTGRVTCYQSPTGSGYNLQTIPNYTQKKDAPGGILGDRDLFLADDGYWFFQCDLKGADGWTVAAYCAMLGDTTMLDDYRAGLKPYQILAVKLRGYPANFKDRDDLRGWCKKIEKDAWDGFACKRVQHGGAYLEGNITISRNILKDSEGKLYLSPSECDPIKKFYFERYWGIPKWHDWTARRIKENRTLVAASGQVREFFGRPDEILTKAVAYEPQSNTTFATNLAMWQLWKDPENRDNTQKLKIEPLHQVHDALCGQFKKTETSWAIDKIRKYFNNPITIAGQTLVIPFDGAYGMSWGQQTEGVI